MKMPPEIIPCNKWIAYIGPLPKNSGKSHTVVIIYREKSQIHYFYVTSQIEKARKRYKNDKEALVTIDRNDWSGIRKTSCIQCGKPHLYSADIKQFQTMYQNEELKMLGEIPEVVKNKITCAIFGSITYTAAEKRIYSTL